MNYRLSKVVPAWPRGGQVPADQVCQVGISIVGGPGPHGNRRERVNVDSLQLDYLAVDGLIGEGELHGVWGLFRPGSFDREAAVF